MNCEHELPPGSRWWRKGFHQGWCAFVDDKTLTEAQGAALITSLGIWLLYFDMFASCPNVYAVMKSVMPEKVWGTLFIGIGLTQMAALITGTISLRRHVLLFKGAMWTFLLFVVAISDFSAPGVPIYCILALAAFRGFLCLKPSPSPHG